MGRANGAARAAPRASICGICCVPRG